MTLLPLDFTDDFGDIFLAALAPDPPEAEPPADPGMADVHRAVAEIVERLAEIEHRLAYLTERLTPPAVADL